MPTAIKKVQVALAIAGSDPSGGAGIQADIKTFTNLGVYGAAAITCLTAQNTRGIFAIQPVEPDMVRKQIAHVLDDLYVTHIKIGMLGSEKNMESICDELADFPGEILFDPVLISSSGQELIDPGCYTAIRRQLLPLCTVITPNVPELSILTKKECSSKDMLLIAAEELLQEYQKLRAVIVTGGHFETERDVITDFMLISMNKDHKTDLEEISHKRIRSINTHGTGCTCSSAFTAYHMVTGDYKEAFKKSIQYMDILIRASTSATIGHGSGPLLHHLK